MAETPPSKGKPTEARFAVAENLAYLMEHYQLGEGIDPTGIEERGGPSAKTIRRLLKPYTDTGPSLDTLDEVASFFGIETWKLLKRRKVGERWEQPHPKPQKAAVVQIRSR